MKSFAKSVMEQLSKDCHVLALQAAYSLWLFDCIASRCGLSRQPQSNQPLELP